MQILLFKILKNSIHIIFIIKNNINKFCKKVPDWFQQ